MITQSGAFDPVAGCLLSLLFHVMGKVDVSVDVRNGKVIGFADTADVRPLSAPPDSIGMPPLVHVNGECGTSSTRATQPHWTFITNRCP